MNKLFEKYLNILKLKKHEPSIHFLNQLVSTHLIKIPFENISKLYYLKKYGLKYIPDFELYLNGIEQYNFGGTCYSNNYYFNQLLNHLGFEASLCGGKMENPDEHLVNIVKYKNQIYLVDVGYAAPFYNPIPLKENDSISLKFGNEKYNITLIEKSNNIQVNHIRNDDVIHGYNVDLRKKNIEDFEKPIKNSFSSNATFLNNITAVKFEIGYSVSIRDCSFIKMTKNSMSVRKFENLNEIISGVDKYLQIPGDIIQESVKDLKITKV